MEQRFRFGTADRLVRCGSGVIKAVNKLVRAGSHMDITPMTTSYGLKVAEWHTNYGTLYFKTHPLMSQEQSTRRMAIILPPSNIKFRYIDDTVFYGEGERGVAAPGTNYGRVDARNEEYLTEAGFEFQFPDMFMILNGWGNDNNL